jgi:transposase
MWEPFRKSLKQRAPQCKIVYDKFHVVKRANAAIDEVRRAEFFWQGPQKRGLIQIQWRLLTNSRSQPKLPAQRRLRITSGSVLLRNRC